MNGVDAVAFDLYGTLAEVASVGRAAAEVTEDPAALVDLWRQKQLKYTWLRSLMGRYEDFWASPRRRCATRSVGWRSGPARRRTSPAPNPSATASPGATAPGPRRKSSASPPTTSSERWPT